MGLFPTAEKNGVNLYVPGDFKKRMKEKGSLMAQAHKSRNKPERWLTWRCLGGGSPDRLSRFVAPRPSGAGGEKPPQKVSCSSQRTRDLSWRTALVFTAGKTF